MKLVYYKRKYVEYQIYGNVSLEECKNIDRLLQENKAIGLVKEDKKTTIIDKDTKSLSEIEELIKSQEYNIVDIEILAVSDVYR